MAAKIREPTSHGTPLHRLTEALQSVENIMLLDGEALILRAWK
jgi:hypothetical protein